MKKTVAYVNHNTGELMFNHQEAMEQYRQKDQIDLYWYTGSEFIYVFSWEV